ncbi:MAG: isochorismatase family cysteine hydrolase [Pseudomonadota bacterium]
MHQAGIRQHIVDRVIKRRGKLHWFDALELKRTALVVIDMQSTFCEPGSPAEVASSRAIVSPINELTGFLREKNIPIFWVLHANTHLGDRSDWELFFDNVVSSDVRTRTMESLMPGRQTVWRDLDTAPEDIVVIKNRYSALIAGSSTLEPMLRNYGIDTLLIAGTKTNVCCESTGRDAMMLDFKVVMVSDCCAALSDDEHQATLETFIQQFGDVMSAAEVVSRLGPAD